MQKELLFLFALFALFSCGNKETQGPDYALLKEKYHGKYKIISSVSQDSVDLNRDGILSTDLMSENPYMKMANVEIRILDYNKNIHLFDEMYPIMYDAPFPGGSTLFEYYALYSNNSLFVIDEKNRTFTLISEVQQDGTNTLIAFESVKIQDEEIIEVTATRKFLTINGWLTTKIISRYKRYTIVT